MTKVIKNSKELFVFITGFEKYKVSNFGRIFSCRRKKIIKPYKNYRKNKNGEIKTEGHSIVLWGEVNKRFYVHQLVAMMFLPKKPGGEYTIDHIDRNPSNNHYTNLRWANNKQQMENRVSQRMQSIKLTTSEIHELYLRTKKESLTQIGKTVGICNTSLSIILKYTHPLY